jgi:hypothetical protein
MDSLLVRTAELVKTNKRRQIMKNIFYLVSVLFAALVLSSCEKETAGYDTLYGVGPDGQTYCRIPQLYNIAKVGGKLLILVDYSGQWEIELDPQTTWAFLDRTNGKGQEYVRLCYDGNTTASERQAVVTLSCDNGETVDISVIQTN